MKIRKSYQLPGSGCRAEIRTACLQVNLLKFEVLVTGNW